MVYNRYKYFGFNFLVVSLISAFPGCSEKKVIDEHTAVICMDKKISIADFRLFYELDPTFPSYKSGTEGLQEFAEELAAKILAKELAEEEGIFDKQAAKYALDYRQKTAAIRCFYQEQIENEIEVSQDEMKSAFMNMSARVQLKQLFLAKEKDALYYHDLLKKSIPFDTLAAQVFKDLGSGPTADLGLVSWGQLDEDLETTAWSLNPGEYSQPVRSKWGYHILYVTARHDLFIPSNDEFVRRKQSVYKKVKRKKEEKAAKVYLKEYLGPLDIKVKRGAFLKLTGALNIDVETGKQSSRPLRSDQLLSSITNAQIEQMEKILKDDLTVTFMSSKLENWSIQKFLNKVKQIPQYKRPKLSSLRHFKEDIGIVIRNDFLYKQAVKEGHLKNSFVDSTVTAFMEETAYEFYLRKYFFDMEVADNVAKYFSGMGKKPNDVMSKPEAVLDGMKELRSFRAYYAAKKLHQDLFEKYSQEVIIYNMAFLKEEAKRINWQNPIRMFVPEKY